MPDSQSDEIVSVRLPEADLEAIARLVDKGEYRNRTDFIRYAIKAALDRHRTDGAPRVRADVEAGGAPISPLGELGEIAPATGARQRRAAGGNLRQPTRR